MTNLTENQMAAIAAGLWEPNPHYHSAPDMRDPANLWRALEGSKFHLWTDGIYWTAVDHNAGRKFTRERLADAVFAALVALYKAEHPQE